MCRLAGILAAGFLTIASAAQSEPLFVVTPDAPAVVPLEDRSTHRVGPRYLDVTVRGFLPANDGPVQVVVEVVRSGMAVEIGRFGIYPEQPFVPAERAKQQYFRLTVPDDLQLSAGAHVTLRLQPTRGAGKGAAMTVGPLQISGPDSAR